MLDEQLNPVITGDGKNSYFEQVGAAGGTSVKQYNIIKRAVTKSGYVYVYVSNETPNIDVYWDNLKVTQKRGRLASEEGYYPFGLAMNALSSHAGTIVNNAYKYNSGTELTEDLDVDYYETYLRQYDAQVGRFTGVDVLAETTIALSPYQYGINNPVSYNDPTGMTAAQQGWQSPVPKWRSRRGPILWNGEDYYGGMNIESYWWEAYGDDMYGATDFGNGGGGGSGGGTGGGFSLSGGAAQDFMRALQNAQQNADVDGNWQLDIAMQDGKLGYWAPYFNQTGDFSDGLERVELGQSFRAFDDGGGGDAASGYVYKILCGGYNWKTTGTAYTAQIYGLNIFYDNQRTSQKITFSLSPACITIPKHYFKDTKSTYEVSNAFNDAFNFAIRSVLDILNSLPPGYTLSDWEARKDFLPELKSYLNTYYSGSVFAADDGCSGSGIPASYAKFCFP